MARVANTINGFRHIESIKMAFHSKIQLMRSGMVESDVESCYKTIEGTAWNNNQFCNGGKRVCTWNDQEAIFSNGCDVKISLHIIDVGGFFGGSCALFQVGMGATKVGTLSLNLIPRGSRCKWQM